MSPHIKQLLSKKILILDGAMGTMIQGYKPGEKEYRGERFTRHAFDLKGMNDLLVLTQPAMISAIHEAYLAAGADIIETNTFNAQAVSLADYHLEHLSYEINCEAARLAKVAAQKFTLQTPNQPRFVAGSIGPTNRTLSMSADVNNPGARSISFNEMLNAYTVQIEGLLDGGADLLLVETVFDTLVAKACLFAISSVFEKRNISVPVMLSVTISDASGRTLSGQTMEAFLNAVSHFPLLSVGLNCALGAKQLYPYAELLARNTSCYVSVYPNAGLPNQFGAYDETAELMATYMDPFITDGLVNIIGGCCGTTPTHIAALARLAEGRKPRLLPSITPSTTLSGLEPLTISHLSNFINIGERTNVAGSKAFARLIREKNYEEALSVARQQVENGANIIDINMDDGLLDAPREMETFLRYLSSDPDIARVPLMIDSSDFAVIEKGLQNIQGKAIVNSISLKEGEESFLHQARLIRRYGAATVVMAFDENGQATSFDEKTRICKRAWLLLTEKAGFPPEDIVFDCNILTIGTGLPEHNNYAVDFIKAVAWIKENLPGAHTSGGVSNLSFSFRGNNTIREALHAVFLYHAIKAGLDMGIVNAGALPILDSIDPALRTLCEDLILNKRKDATERLLIYAENTKSSGAIKENEAAWRNLPLEERLKYALVKGIQDYAETDVQEALAAYPKALTIIEGPLMDGMNEVGELFGSGRMFLPQVMKSARVMKKMVAIIQPVIELQIKPGEAQSKAGKIVLATVKGDVHDIGKNIVGVVLACNNYDIIDLGIMVPKETILDEAVRHNADIIGLSGLITPSLEEMTSVAAEMKKRKMNIPLIIGGATTSKMHTAVKIAPAYDNLTVYVRDASQAVGVVSSILSSDKRPPFENDIRTDYAILQQQFAAKQNESIKLSPEAARANKFVWNALEAAIVKPQFTGAKVIDSVTPADLVPYIDWTFFFHQWRINGKFPGILTDPVKGPEAQKLYDDALEMLNIITTENRFTARGVCGFYEANGINEAVMVKVPEKEDVNLSFLRNLQADRNNKGNLCLSDYVAPASSGICDYIGLFAVTAGFGADVMEQAYKEAGDDYNAIMVRVLADRLAEAFAEFLHFKVRTEYWAYSPAEAASIDNMLQGKYRGIRPAPGYPACPVHSEKDKIFDILNATQLTGITLTETWAMSPPASVCGYYFAHPKIEYFTV